MLRILDLETSGRCFIYDGNQRGSNDLDFVMTEYAAAREVAECNEVGCVQ
jgi:hypothetical protein